MMSVDAMDNLINSGDFASLRNFCQTGSLTSLGDEFQGSLESTKSSCSEFLQSIYTLREILQSHITNSKRKMKDRTHFLECAFNEILGNATKKLIAYVRDYIFILKEDIKLKKILLERDKVRKTLTKCQVKTSRDIKMFANSILAESMGCVTFSSLETTSQQYIKCRKAFFDNIHPDVKCIRDLNVELFEVFRLDHKYLNSLLQAVVSSNTCQVKGLFCHVPFDFIRNFCAFGIYAQALSFDATVERWYENPWKDVNKFKYSPSQASELVGRSQDGMLQFSKFSTPDNFQYLESLNRDGIGCTSLCRIVLVKLLEMESSPSEDEIRQAKEEFDAVFDKQRDVYYILNPRCVLPEFILFTKYDKVAGNFSPRQTDHMQLENIVLSLREEVKNTTEKISQVSDAFLTEFTHQQKLL